MDDLVFPPATAAVTVMQTCSMESEMAGDDDALAGDYVDQEESSIMDTNEKESSKWTNEKHNLYLKSIEASFVDQLYSSWDTLSRQTQNTCCSDAVSTWNNHPNAFIPSGQFKVLRHGSWSNKSFKRQNLHPKDANRPHVSPGNPWIQHFRNRSLKRPGSPATSVQYPVPDSQLDQETGCSNTEAMGQNFEDASCSREGARASKISHSSNDQVVPRRTFASN